MVDTVVIKQEEFPKEDQAHIDAMVAKVDGTNPPAAETPNERPGWLPDKFKTPEELAKAYDELQKKLGAPKADAPADTSTSPPADPPAADAAEALASKGLDLTEFSKEFGETGNLSEASYQKLQAAGYPKDVVDNYIEGQRARADLFTASVKATVGGDENFTKMTEWAAATLTAAELNAYNAAVESGNVETAKLAVAGLYQKFSTDRPVEPSLIGGGNGAVAGDVYESVYQMKEDMKSEQYKKDPAFRAKVQAKLSRSNIL